MGFSEEVVARFFAAGFISGAVSAYFVGTLADRSVITGALDVLTLTELPRMNRLGRRLLCLVYCVAYTVSCLSIFFRYKPYLYIGRLLGGISTSILYSAFESWMVSEFHGRGLARGSGDGALSHLFGLLTATNSIVAIVAGVSSELLVDLTGTRESPFVASCVLLVIAFVMILMTWVGPI